jgi:hypothetical protein
VRRVLRLRPRRRAAGVAATGTLAAVTRARVRPLALALAQALALTQPRAQARLTVVASPVRATRLVPLRVVARELVMAVLTPVPAAARVTAARARMRVRDRLDRPVMAARPGLAVMRVARVPVIRAPPPALIIFRIRVIRVLWVLLVMMWIRLMRVRRAGRSMRGRRDTPVIPARVHRAMMRRVQATGVLTSRSGRRRLRATVTAA